MPSDPREALRLWVAGGVAPSCESCDGAAELVEAARIQGLAGLLHDAAPPVSRDWPARARSRLRDMRHALLARGVVQLDLAHRGRAILERAGVRSIPLKGAAVAEAYYPSVADRPMGDVDLLALDDWGSAATALRREGFRDVEAADHACAFSDPVSGGLLELHHSVCSCPGFYPLDAEGVWARSRPANGQVGRVPSVEDLLIHLALHAAFQHGLVLSLVQYADFRRVLQQTPPDADRLLAMATAARAEAPLAVALAAAESVVDAPLGRFLRDRLRPHVPGALAPWLERIAASPLLVVSPAPPALLRVRWGLASGRRREWLWRTLAPPAPEAGPVGRRALRAAVRGVTLAWRWGPGSGRRRG